jgi:NADH-quinone oxidoreductase subunit F
LSDLLENTYASYAEYVAAGGGRGLQRALASSPEAIIDEVMRSGLRGRGGAGFPTAIKWQAVRGTGTGDRYVVCNAAEGEPATFKDRYLIRRNPYQVIEGLAITGHVIGARAGYIGMKESFTKDIAIMRRAVEEMTQANALGGMPVEVALGKDGYLLGEETGLLEAIEGRWPMPRTLRPFVWGLWANPGSTNPTDVNNVETLSNVAHILTEGAEWMRRCGSERTPGTMLATVAGDVRREGVVELPTGTPLSEMVQTHFGGAKEGRTIKAILPGASSTVLLPEQFDTPMDFDSMRAVGAGLGSGSYMVFDDTVCMVKVAYLYSRFLWIESCGQCPTCKLGSGAITEAIERIENGEGDVSDLDHVVTRSIAVTDGQRCALPTGETLVVQSIFRAFRDEFDEHVRIGRCPRPRDLVFPKIMDYDEEAGRFEYDERFKFKTPNWTYSDREETAAEMLAAAKA